jgi:tetratricopeptide (TPR) repeat protein
LAQFSTFSSDAEMRRFFTEASELLGENDLLLRGRAWVLLGQPDRALADFSQLIETEPNNAAAHVARGELHARFTRWQQAADDFDAALALNSGDHWQWYRSAALRLKLNDMEGYIRHCREMLDRFGDTELHYIGERISKLCLLVPEAVAATGDAGGRMAAIAGGASETDNLYPYYRLVQGMADYRAGRFDDAAEASADSYERQSNYYAQALAAVFCGMAHHQAGRPDEARHWLDIADQLLDVRMPPESRGDIGSAWHDWIMPHVAREEARALLKAAATQAESDAGESRPVVAP